MHSPALKDSRQKTVGSRTGIFKTFAGSDATNGEFRQYTGEELDLEGETDKIKAARCCSARLIILLTYLADGDSEITGDVRRYSSGDMHPVSSGTPSSSSSPRHQNLPPICGEGPLPR